MGHNFEHDHPHHRVHEVGIPRSGHGHMDQKYEKGMRSPMAGRLPMDNGLESNENAPGLNQEEGSVGGAGSSGSDGGSY